MIIKNAPKNQQVSSPKVVADIFRAILAAEHPIDQEKEHFWVIGLGIDNQVKYVDLVSLGILDASIVHPREVFRLAILEGVKSIIIGHNHPSNNPNPSQEDKNITAELTKAGEILDIHVRDHVIINQNDFYSFAQH